MTFIIHLYMKKLHTLENATTSKLTLNGHIYTYPSNKQRDNIFSSSVEGNATRLFHLTLLRDSNILQRRLASSHSEYLTSRTYHCCPESLPAHWWLATKSRKCWWGGQNYPALCSCWQRQLIRRTSIGHPATHRIWMANRLRYRIHRRILA